MYSKIKTIIKARHEETGGHNGITLQEILKTLKTDLTDEIRIVLVTLENNKEIITKEIKSGYAIYIRNGKQ